MTWKSPCIFNPDAAKISSVCDWLNLCRQILCVWRYDCIKSLSHREVTQMLHIWGMVGWGGGEEGAGIPGCLTNPLPLMRGVSG